MRPRPATALALLLVLVIAPAFVWGQETGGDSRDIRLYAMDCGRMQTNGVIGSDPCFLIRHPRGDLLWDVGVPQAMADAPEGVTRLGTAEIRVTRKLTDLLEQLRMTPADVEWLSVSHTHFDHIGNGALFAASTWIVDADERSWAFRPEARTLPAFAYYRALETAPTRIIEGDDDYDVFGDGSATIIQAPGHTPGHTVLLVRLPQSGAVLLAGDMWNTAEARAARRGTPQALASMDTIERIASETGARIIRQHVPEDFDGLPRFPDFLR